MGNEESIFRGGGGSSLGDFSNKGSFGQAFKAAHSAGGSGHTFTWNGKLYNTNCADGGDYRTNHDDRSVLQHRVHQYGHEVNAVIKDTTGGKGLDNIPVYGRAGAGWSTDIDRQI